MCPFTVNNDAKRRIEQPIGPCQCYSGAGPNDVENAIEGVSRRVALKRRGGADENEVGSAFSGGLPESLTSSRHAGFIDRSGRAGLSGRHIAERLGEGVLPARAHLVELGLVDESNLARGLRWAGGR
jgi:hypothetical protein